ncbi:MAG: hypothetical protein PHX25_01225 [Candidatus Pacebacteria bacterium]|nr:hypothetical protein [Candidatus Paceibacterota bacterium]
MRVNVEVDIPEGKTCCHSDGQLCCLYNPGIEGRPRCWGWDNHEIIDLKKHIVCLSLRETSQENSRDFIKKNWPKSSLDVFIESMSEHQPKK